MLAKPPARKLLVRHVLTPREQVRRIVREGDAVWPAELLALRQASTWDEPRQQRLQQDIQDGHCGAMPDAMLPGMVNAR